jgi:hypothetical protein
MSNDYSGEIQNVFVMAVFVKVRDGQADPQIVNRTHTREIAKSVVVSNEKVQSEVMKCPDRGGVLPLSMQDDCGCRNKELSECRVGRGTIPGRVTLSDCLTCRSVFLATSPPPPKIELATTITLEQKLAICEGCIWGVNGVCGETNALFTTSARLGCPVGRHGGPLPGRQD